MSRLCVALLLLVIVVPVARADERAPVREWAQTWRMIERDLTDVAPDLYTQARGEMAGCISGAPVRERIQTARWIAIDGAIRIRARMLERRAGYLQRLDLDAEPLRALRAAQVAELRAWAEEARQIRAVTGCEVLQAVDHAAQELPAYPLAPDVSVLLTPEFLGAVGYRPAEVVFWTEAEGVMPRRTQATARVRSLTERAAAVLRGRGWEMAVARTLHQFTRDPIADA